ncbi:unnamed protein product [Cylicocyclus nassatus]|uniref:Uncharacterized protein n=1 Tax=Cylicocyclus nassatus TaxID=53992 RepID=A0AA36DL54_CYLNA|nr:unnamed protein product [Cylicocyclus nassatus]
MSRSLFVLCLIALVALINALPVAVVERYIPIAVDPDGVPLHRVKRQFFGGFGFPFGGFGGFGGSYGNSYGYSQSSSF